MVLNKHMQLIQNGKAEKDSHRKMELSLNQEDVTELSHRKLQRPPVPSSNPYNNGQPRFAGKGKRYQSGNTSDS